MASENNFQFEFDCGAIHYIAYVIPTFDLSTIDLIVHNIQQHSFLIKLFSIEGFKTFELFIDEDLEWHTNASELLISDEIVQLIGKRIDDKTM